MDKNKYNPNTGEELLEGQSVRIGDTNTMVTGGDVGVKPISLDVLNATEKPVVTPEPKVETSPVITLNKEIENETDRINKQKESEVNVIADLIKGIGDESGKELNYFEQEGGREAEKIYKTQVDKLTAEQRALDLKKREITSNARYTKEQASNAISAIERQSLQKQADIAILATMAKGDVDSARQYAKDKVDATIRPLQAELDARKFIFDSNKDLFSKAEGAKLEELFAEKQRTIEREEKTLQSIENIKIEAAKNGMNSFAGWDNVKTVNEALNLAGKYMAKDLYDYREVGDSLIKINKVTGQVSNAYNGSSSTSTDLMPVMRTVITSDGSEVPVDGYTLLQGDDPYFIAQKYGTNMDELKKLNPNISDWKNLPVGSVINIPNKDMNYSILNTTGLSMPAFKYLSEGTSALTRMPADLRIKYMTEAQNYVNRTGTDVATFQAQNKAIDGVVQNAIMRNFHVNIAADDMAGDIENLKAAAKNAGITNLKGLNVAKILAGQQLGSPSATEFVTQLQQLQNTLMYYDAASQGQIDSNGNIRENSEADAKRVAEGILNRGLASGSLNGFEKAMKISQNKMNSVMERAVDSAKKQKWELFGVGDKYQSQEVKQDHLEVIKDYGIKHPEDRQTLIDMQNDGVTIEAIISWINQQG